MVLRKQMEESTSIPLETLLVNRDVPAILGKLREQLFKHDLKARFPVIIVLNPYFENLLTSHHYYRNTNISSNTETLSYLMGIQTDTWNRLEGIPFLLFYDWKTYYQTYFSLYPEKEAELKDTYLFLFNNNYLNKDNASF